MISIGIDNGLDGGICVLSDYGSVLDAIVMPVIGKKGDGKRVYDIPAIVHFLKVWGGRIDAKAFLERAQAMPKQGSSSTFSIGLGYGIMQGVLTALGIPFTIVGPQQWQKEMFKGIDKTNTKKASALIASRLSPQTDWRGTERSTTPHDGKTDAYCIGVYGSQL